MNPSGIVPMEYRVLVKPDTFEEKTKGGIYLPDNHKERQQGAQQKGRLIALGGNAFEDFGDPKPQKGDRIFYARYAGAPVRGADGCEYRMISDKDIIAIIENEAAFFEDEEAA